MMGPETAQANDDDETVMGLLATARETFASRRDISALPPYQIARHGMCIGPKIRVCAISR